MQNKGTLSRLVDKMTMFYLLFENVLSDSPNKKTFTTQNWNSSKSPLFLEEGK